MKNFLLLCGFAFGLAATLVLASGCSLFGSRADQNTQDHQAQIEKHLPSGELSLEADRSALAAERESIPEEIKRENDELALVLQLMRPESGYEVEPGKVREGFNKALRSRRQKTDGEFRKARAGFSKEEKQRRDDFLKRLKEQRDSFVKGKPDGERRREFFSQEDLKRREFFAGESDRRKEFESNLNQRRKDFEDRAREATNRFNQEHREYSKEFYERRKAKSLQKRMQDKEKRLVQDGKKVVAPGGASADVSLEDWKKIPPGPGYPLGSSDGN